MLSGVIYGRPAKRSAISAPRIPRHTGLLKSMFQNEIVIKAHESVPNARQHCPDGEISDDWVDSKVPADRAKYSIDRVSRAYDRRVNRGAQAFPREWCDVRLDLLRSSGIEKVAFAAIPEEQGTQ